MGGMPPPNQGLNSTTVIRLLSCLHSLYAFPCLTDIPSLMHTFSYTHKLMDILGLKWTRGNLLRLSLRFTSAHPLPHSLMYCRF